jgi:gluconolactonase
LNAGALTEVESDLGFPEGPVAMRDGSVVLVEISRGTIARVGEDGGREVIAEPGGGPNGAAIGPDGKLYVCNNGKAFDYVDMQGLNFPVQPPTAFEGGRIERVDLDSGEVEVLFEECDGRPVRAPNDLVFDAHGGFYFTDHGLREEWTSDRTAVYYATPGGDIRMVIHPLDAPNGIGLSPDGKRLYVAETYTCCLWWWEVGGPGEIVPPDGALLPHGGTLLTRLPGFQFMDSLGVDSAGNVCVATPGSGGISVISPEDGSLVEFVATGDILTTNVCWGGDELRTAYITMSGTGKLAAVEWPRPGLELAHYA